MDFVLFGYKLNLEVLILICVLYIILAGTTFCSCCSITSGQEGFVGANTNYGQSAPFSIANYTPPNISSWFPGNLSIQAGKPPSKAAKQILNRPSQPVPLPKGEMLLFATTEFKPECCPNAYSTSTGCACMTTSQYNYLTNRGGNNTPYSEY
jgi:hypothetical protein